MASAAKFSGLRTIGLVAGAWPSFAQEQSSSPNNGQSQQQAQQTPDNGKPKQDAPPAAGGPGADSGPYAVPKKKEETPPPPPPPAAAKKIEGLPDYSLKVNVPLVNVDVLVTTKDGQAIPGLKKDHFRILEDGVPQTVTNFSVTQAPITAVLLTDSPRRIMYS